MPHPLPTWRRPTLLALATLATLATPASGDVTVAGTRLAAHAADAAKVRDGAATSGRALQLRSARTVTTTVTLDSPAKAITIRARGVACGGPAAMSIAVDRGRPTVRTLRSSNYETFSLTGAVRAGTHRLALRLVKAHRGPGCRRAVLVDQIRVTASRTAVALETTPSLAALVADVLPSPASSVVPAAPTMAPLAPAPLPPTTSEPDPTTSVPPSTGEPDPTTSVPPTTSEPDPTTSVPPTTSEPDPVDVRPKLRWAPPALSSPTTITVAQGDQAYTLATTKDYIINLGAEPHNGAVNISGGRNVVILGGRITLTALSAKVTALNIKNSVGTVHVEGVAIDSTDGREMDAIQIQAPAAIVQIENVRADGLLGSYETNHSDVIQPWGGVSKLRVDRLTADSNYQGIFTRPDQGAIGSVELRHVDLAFNNAAAGSSGGFLLWMTTGCDMAPTTLSDVYVQPRTGKSVGAAVWPPTSDANCPAKLTGGQVTWPKLPVSGAVTGGAPAGGAFVPAGVAGPGYVSPGYE